MALTRRNPAASFEKAPDTDPTAPAAAPAQPAAAAPAQPAAQPQAAAATQPAASAPAPAAAPAPATPAQTGLVAQVPRSTAVANLQAGHAFLDSLKDALRVEWDTLTRIKASQGRLAADKINFGEWIEFELMSWQDNYLVSPGGDTDEAKALAKYSDDGKTIKDTGEDINVYLKRLKDLGYPDARLGKRCILAASLIDCDKDAQVDDGMLFQIDLSPTSRAEYERYRIQCALDLGKGRTTGDEVIRIRATAEVKQQSGKSQNEYTLLKFSRAKAAA